MPEPNPYVSPQSSCPPEQPALSPPRRFRWRVIPVVLFALFGGFAVLGGGMMTVTSISLQVNGQSYMGLGTGQGTLGAGLFWAAGIAGLCVALTLWRQKWGAAAILFLVMVASNWAGQSLFNMASRQYSAEQEAREREYREWRKQRYQP